MPRPSSVRAKALAEGYRSGLEEQVSATLRKDGVAFSYESHVIRYSKPARVARYTPDFILPNGIIIETKGRFVTADRQKHLLILDQHPNLDIRFVFSNPRSRISKTSKTSYAMWCEKHGFLFAKVHIPTDWIAEPHNPQRFEALAQAGLTP
jgi:hypothetical protein